MGIAQGENFARLSKVATAFIVVLFLTASVPAIAIVYDYAYTANTGTVRAPTVSLGGGTAGSSTVSSVAPDAAEATVTAGLTFYQSATAPVNVASIDGTPQSASGRAPSRTLTITTTKANDVLYVAAAPASTTITATVGSSPTLTWNARATLVGPAQSLYTFYAIAATANTYTVTVTYSARTNEGCLGFAISGLNTASPFDSGVSSVATGTGTGSTASVSITTNNPRDIFIGTAAITTSGTAAASTGTQLATITNSVTAIASDQLATSTVSNQAVSFSTGSGTATWAEAVEAFVEAVPSQTSDTSVAAPGSSSSYALSQGASAFYWSPAFTAGSTLYSGTWQVQIWASAATSGTLQISVYIVDASNNIVSTLVAPSASSSVGTTKGQVNTALNSVPGVTIPSNDVIMVVLSAPPTGPTSFTIYWGTGQLTNFQTVSTYNYFLAVTNTASTTWNVNLATTSGQTSQIGRLSATISFVSPASDQIIVTGGSLAQPSGSAVTLAASATIGLEIVVTSGAMPTSSNMPSSITFSLKVASTSSSVFAQYTIILTID